MKPCLPDRQPLATPVLFAAEKPFRAPLSHLSSAPRKPLLDRGRTCTAVVRSQRAPPTSFAMAAASAGTLLLKSQRRRRNSDRKLTRHWFRSWNTLSAPALPKDFCRASSNAPVVFSASS